LATGLNNVAAQAETEMWLGEAHWLLGRHDLALETSRHGLTLAQSLGHKSLLVQISLRRGAWLREQGAPAEALACLEPALEAASRDTWEDNTLRVLAEVGRVHLQAGAEAALEDVLAQMARLAPDTKDPRLHVIYHWLLGEVALRRSDYPGFCDHYRQAQSLARSADNDWFRQLQRETRARLDGLLSTLTPEARRDCEAILA